MHAPADSPLLVRAELPADIEAVRRVHRLAFGSDAEPRLVDALRDGGWARLSLVAEYDSQIAGHILFSDLPIETRNGAISALSLAPLAVLPEFQRRGIGSELIGRGLEQCRSAGHRIVVVLGHPRYYGRFGFSADAARPLDSPWSGEAFMALELETGALHGVSGRVVYPPPFFSELDTADARGH